MKSYLLKRVSTVRIRPGAPEDYDGVARAAPFLVCGSCRRFRTVDTRVTHFPAGGVFESARGHQRNIEPGTATVPGSSGSCHVKNEAPACWVSKRAPVSEYVCGESRNERWGGD